MQNLSQLANPIAPTAIHPFIDRIQLWPLRPLDHRAIKELRIACEGRLSVRNEPARFNARLRQCIQIWQPTDRALRILVGHEVLINRIEIAADWIFGNRADRDTSWSFLHGHWVRRWHGKNQEIRTVSGTRYDAGYQAPNKTVFYPEKYSRVTGEVNCLHIEWHLNELNAVRLAGIETVRDVLEFSHHDFWAKRLLLYNVDENRLGRLINNHNCGTKRRTSKITHFGSRFCIDMDRRVGWHHVSCYDTVQELVDNLRSKYRISRALLTIPNDTLCPP